MDRGLMARATASDDSPTPGYMYGEIAKMTLASGDACKSIVEYLLQRCAKKNANVKLKALVIIKHVAPQGRQEFRRDICRQLGPIKDCLQFTGPPDALRGDEMYRRVREAAKEALDAVTSEYPQSGGGLPRDRMQGFSSEGSYGGAQQGGFDGGYNHNHNYNSNNGGGYNNNGGGGYNNNNNSNGGGRYEGYGNSPMPPAAPETALGKMAAYASGFKETALDAAAIAISKVGSASGGVGGGGGYVGGSDQGTGRMQGMGNPSFDDARQDRSYADKAGSALRKASSTVRNLAFRNEMREDLSTVYASNRGANAYGTPNYTPNYTGSYERPDIPGGGGGGVNGSWQQQQQQQQQQTWNASASEQASAEYNSSSRRDDAPPPREPDPSYNERGRGGVGGGWGSSSSGGGGGGGQSRSSSGFSASYNTSSPSSSSRAPSYAAGADPTMGGHVGAAKTDGEYERTLVFDLCAAGGTRAVPPPDKVETFLLAAATLDAEVVGPNLLELLAEDQAWQTRSKALALVEALATAAGCEKHREYFADVAQDLAYLAEQPPIQVQRQARKTLAALGMDVASSAAETTRRAALKKAQQQDATFDAPTSSSSSSSLDHGEQPSGQNNNDATNLLGDDDEDEDAGDGDAPPPAAPAADLLGDYEEASPAPAAPSLFDSLETAAPPPSQAAKKKSAEPPSLFDALETAAPPPLQGAEKISAEPPSLFDALETAAPVSILDSFVSETTAPQAPDESIFDSLSLSDGAAAATAPPAAVPATPSLSPLTGQPIKADPFATLDGISRPAKPPARAGGPAFVAQHPGQQQQPQATMYHPQMMMQQQQQPQMMMPPPPQQQHQQQQMTPQQMQQVMMFQQQQQQQIFLAQQQRMQQAGMMAPPQPHAHPQAAMVHGHDIPNVDLGGPGSGFSFISQQKKGDSFSFVSDLIKPK